MDAVVAGGLVFGLRVLCKTSHQQSVATLGGSLLAHASYRYHSPVTRHLHGD